MSMMTEKDVFVDGERCLKRLSKMSKEAKKAVS